MSYEDRGHAQLYPLVAEFRSASRPVFPGCYRYLVSRSVLAADCLPFF